VIILQEHARILKEIADDREKKRMMTHAPVTMTTATSSAPSPANQKTETASSSTSASCLLQVS